MMCLERCSLSFRRDREAGDGHSRQHSALWLVKLLQHLWLWLPEGSGHAVLRMGSTGFPEDLHTNPSFVTMKAGDLGIWKLFRHFLELCQCQELSNGLPVVNPTSNFPHFNSKGVRGQPHAPFPSLSSLFAATSAWHLLQQVFVTGQLS